MSDEVNATQTGMKMKWLRINNLDNMSRLLFAVPGHVQSLFKAIIMNRITTYRMNAEKDIQIIAKFIQLKMGNNFTA
uniref:Uncharacterized protein n=1 Tax=Arion vulgaris TaxID=1028688 RepID=A0A0B7B013_9EUPU